MKESAEGLKKLDENGMGDSKKIGEGNFGVVYKVAQWKEEISSENTKIWIFPNVLFSPFLFFGLCHVQVSFRETKEDVAVKRVI